MFLASYNLVKFGSMIKNLRERERFTQQEIRNITGIHTDTLRRIENGLTIPKYSTLEILSIMYKVDLISLLNNFKVRHTIYDLYLQMDQIIISNDASLKEDINNLLTEIDNIDNKSEEWNLVDETQLRQMKLFIQSIKNYKFKLESNKSIVTTLIECIGYSIDKFDLSHFQQHKYNHLELRILMIISLCKVGNKHYSTSNEILVFIKKTLSSREYLSTEDIKILLKTITNIAYNCYLLERHDETISHCNQGIAIAREHQTMYSLHLIYARRAIAKIRLSDNTYNQDIETCLTLLRVQGHSELEKTYIEVFEKKYKYKSQH